MNLGKLKGEAELTFADHKQCVALSSLFRGKLCDRITKQPVRLLRPGELVYERGESASSVFLLEAGLVKTGVISEEGSEIILGLHKPGAIFGELCICTGERREYAIAMKESKVAEIAFADLISHLENDRAAMSSFLTNICQRLSDAYEQIQALAFDDAPTRLARTLLKLADELGRITPAGVRIGYDMQQEELAQMVGASREVVSIWLNRLRAMGCISYSRQEGLVIHPKALQNYLESRVR